MIGSKFLLPMEIDLDVKMEVLYQIGPYFVRIFPEI